MNRNLFKVSEKDLKDCNIEKVKVIAHAYAGRQRIASASNRRGSGRVSERSYHAEEFLVRKLRRIRAKERFGRITVVVIRLTRGGVLKPSKPCPKCDTILTEYGIFRVCHM